MLRLRASMETTLSCDGGHGVLTWARSCKSQGPLTDVTAAHERFFRCQRLQTIRNDWQRLSCKRLCKIVNPAEGLTLDDCHSVRQGGLRVLVSFLSRPPIAGTV